MNAFELAKEFKDWVAREWPGHNPTPGDLFSFFEDWAQEPNDLAPELGDLIGRTGGDYMMGHQTWTVVQAQFALHPEEFAAIRDFVTALLDLEPDATRLPGILDPDEWQRQLSERLSR